MLCIKGTAFTNTETGKVYECVGQFVCPHCGLKSPILEFAPPVQIFESIDCYGCKAKIDRYARYSHQERFIPLTGNENLLVNEHINLRAPAEANWTVSAASIGFSLDFFEILFIHSNLICEMSRKWSAFLLKPRNCWILSGQCISNDNFVCLCSYFESQSVANSS